ncbi:MAG: IS1634 family transposase [Oligoflexales bacterium]|nr:IS1634 family transposase [Oligoflexales bacterium]
MDGLAEAKRLDHHGIVAGVIKDLQLVAMIDELLGSDACEEISEGESVAGMIINGLDFTNRPLSLTPQFFKQIPVEDLFRDGVEAEHFNRHKLGRSLDKIHKFGCEGFFAHLAMKVAQVEGVNTQILSLDTTSFYVTGEKYEDTDENAVRVTHGYSKDHRPDLPQIVQELLVSHDEGIPLAMCCHNGNASDNVIFTSRCAELKESVNFKKSDAILVADNKLYCEKK